VTAAPAAPADPSAPAAGPLAGHGTGPATGAVAGLLASAVRDVADHPRPGVVFKDITPVLADAHLLATVVEALAAPFRDQVDVVAAVEARGFVVGAPVAVALGAGLVPVRKAGKLPGVTLGEDYTLEYGTDRVEVVADALVAGQRVLVVDDVVATGGTLDATLRLVRRTGATPVAVAALIELRALGGRQVLGSVPLHALWTT
jgi:adenine phosphoribosyltransferase